jgi:uncharacterized membrane protein
MNLFFIGFGLFRLLCFVFFILLFIKIITIGRKKMYRKHMEYSKSFGVFEAMNLAAKRFADGDITADQFREISSILKE